VSVVVTACGFASPNRYCSVQVRLAAFSTLRLCELFLPFGWADCYLTLACFRHLYTNYTHQFKGVFSGGFAVEGTR
jgi:hypothetical protein